MKFNSKITFAFWELPANKRRFAIESAISSQGLPRRPSKWPAEKINRNLICARREVDYIVARIPSAKSPCCRWQLSSIQALRWRSMSASSLCRCHNYKHLIFAQLLDSMCPTRAYHRIAKQRSGNSWNIIQCVAVAVAVCSANEKGQLTVTVNGKPGL